MQRPLLNLLFVLMMLFAVSLSAVAQSPNVAPTAANDENYAALTDTTGVRLGEASATATRLLFVTKKDTIIFDFDALVNDRGASLGDALQKLPGMEVRSGVLYYRGKQVKRLMVNGIDFSRDNPQLALSNLPAYIVKNVKAYESLTDEAKITGIDDGVRNQVVDVILRREYNGTWTGQGTAAGGTEKTFALRGFANTFTDRYRVSLFGNANNINDQMWYNGDGSEQRYNDEQGRNTYRTPGASMFWKSDKEMGKRGYFLFEMSGDYNNDLLRNNDRTDRENYLEQGNTYSVYQNQGRGGETRWVARPSLKWNPTDWTYLHLQADWYRSNTHRRNQSARGLWSQNIFAYGDGVLDSLVRNAAGWPNAEAATTLSQHETKSKVTSDNLEAQVYLTQRLTDNNWRFTLRNRFFNNDNKSHYFSINDYRYYQSAEKPHEILNRYVLSHTFSRGQATYFDLNLPVFAHTRLRASYAFSTTRKKGDYEGYLFNHLGAPYDDFTTAKPLLGLLPDAATQWQAKAREAETTRWSDNFQRKHMAQLDWMYKNKGWLLNVQGALQFFRETLDYEKVGYAPLHYRRNYRDGFLYTMLNYEGETFGELGLNYDFESSAPEYETMITIPDNSDPLRKSLGNPNLKFKKRHDFSVEYTKDHEELEGKLFSSLRVMAGMDFTENEIIYAQAYNRTTGVTTTMPVNVNGMWDGTARVYWGIPWQKSLTATLVFTYNLSHRKGLETLDDFSTLNFQTTNLHTLSWMVMANYRQGKFELSLPISHYITRYASDYESVDGEATSHFRIAPTITWKLPRRFELRSTTKVDLLRGYGSEVGRRNRADINFRLSKTFLKSNNLTAYVEANDLLHHNDGFYSQNEATFFSRSFSERLGRYFMLGLTYRFSTKK